MAVSLTVLQRQALERAYAEAGIPATSIHSSTRRSLLDRGLLIIASNILYITDAGKAAIGVTDPLPPPGYGFPGLPNDGFKDLAFQLGVDTVGAPLHWARYLAPDVAYQLTERGRMEAVKLDDNTWRSTFYESYRLPAGKGWPVENNREAWPIYRGSDAHIADGQQPAVDLGNQLGLVWTAYHDGIVMLVEYGDPEAGNFLDLHWMDDGVLVGLRYCHGGNITVSAGQQVRQGDVLGHVGYSGLVFPPGPAGAHAHLAMWRSGVRVRPEDYL